MNILGIILIGLFLVAIVNMWGYCLNHRPTEDEKWTFPRKD